MFHGFVPGLVPGMRYGLRVDGPWDPANGLRFSPAKVLLPPHARAVTGSWDNTQAVFGHQLARPKRRSDTNGARHVALGVAIDRQEFDWGDHERPRIPLSETIIYEVHVKGFTKLMEWVPEEFRGTYAGLAHPAAVEYLKNLGVTAVELLPIHQFVQDAHLAEKGLRNYWGYNSIGFFAPHNEYAATGDTGHQVDEFKGMVKALHAAGLEVILDVVYNHTAEGNDLRPDLQLQGHRQPVVLPAGGRRRRALLRHHRHRQQLQRQPPRRTAAHHGLAALLGRGHAHRRVPLRPRDDADPPGRRRQPATAPSSR